MFKKVLIILLSVWPVVIFSQEKPEGDYKVFYHENGKISSEGIMVNGKPDGYWKTYNEAGTLVSEGNRKDFLLDSLWKFYNEQGELLMEINYEKGKKNGIRKIIRENEIIEEQFVNDVKEGPTKYFYPGGKLKKIVYFENGIEEGLSKEYAADGRIITLIEYEKGYITRRERINRFDQQQKRHGAWKEFYNNEVVKMEGNYKHGQPHGYFKTYDREGNLLKAEKYLNGELQKDAEELRKLDVVKEYYPDGKLKTVATFKDDIQEGVTKQYTLKGEIENAIVYKNGVVVGEGPMTEKGERNGSWKEYYDSGKLKTEGQYKNDIKVGEWKYYHESGNLEQIGNFNDEGKYVGEWKWFYENGNLLRKETYRNGMADGLMTEYDEYGNVVVEGDYIEGLENGFWYYDYGDVKIEGEYIDGLRNGMWKHYHSSGQLIFQGRFIDDNPNGKHTWYWPNGNIKDEGYYVMGRKDGEWKKYSAAGEILLRIDYQQGKETKYDGIKVSVE
ncbi:MAG: toxin-antitoxin system YwqK family antitoxin [Bacteroidales bacterium]|nr:toxin-antitoxin system YwqK family antitoxin [Bacteroidales bacterium]MCF8387164.1 toxin-antitoxin system YwqK family antitoxin [Bacteroidales bacterium]MCF8397656.1 toxin-antitoxin system YwqK family antitoxin [Bacteroidales bacterium]